VGGSEVSQAVDDRKVARHLFFLLLAVYLLSASLHIDSGDGETMYRVAYGLATGRGLAVPVAEASLVEGRTGYGKVGRDGRYYSKYGLGWSLAVIPLCLLGRGGAALLPGVTEGFATRAAVMLFNPLASAVVGVLLFHLARCVYPRRLAVVLSLLCALGTIAWYYAKSAFSEPLVVLLLLQAILAVERRRFVVAGFALGGMIFTRQTALLLAVPVALWTLTRDPWMGLIPLLRRSALVLLPMGLGQLAVLGYNIYRFEDALVSGYGRVSWRVPLLQGLYNQLLSPGKGLFVFMPMLLLGIIGWPALFKKRRDWAWLVLIVVVCHLIPHALYGNWSGGGGWGPRLLLPIVPLLLLPAGSVIRRWQGERIGRVVLLGLVTVSLLLQVLGVSVGWGRHLQRVWDTSATPDEYFERVHYHWPDSPIPGQMRSLLEVLRLVARPEGRAALARLVDSRAELPSSDCQSDAVGLLSFNAPNFWFVQLWFLRIPAVWLFGIGLVLLGMAVGAALRLRRALND
jgi:hypothetical protein